MKTFWKGLRVRTWMSFLLGCILVLISQLSKSPSAGIIGGIGLFVWFIGFIDMMFAHGEKGAFESFEAKPMKHASTASIIDRRISNATFRAKKGEV